MADNNNFMGSTVAVAVTAAILSPGVRGLLRKGAVQGLAGVLIAGDALSSFARGVGRGLQAENAGPQPHAPAAETIQEPAAETIQEAVRAAQEAARAAQAAAEAAQSAAAKPTASSRRRTSAATPKASTKARGSESR
jgi:hypothetical protein